MLVSIIMPVFNEERHVGKALEAIAASHIEGFRLELIIIDGGSTDSTLSIVKAFSHDKLETRILVFPNKSVYQSLNIGVRHASGKYLLRVDARSFIPKEYLDRCIKHLESGKSDVVGGVQKLVGKGSVGKTLAFLAGTRIGSGGSPMKTGGSVRDADTVYLGAYRLCDVVSCGGFDEDGIVISEDAALNFRLRRLGRKITVDPSLMVSYPAKETFSELARQYLIYGGAKGFVFNKYRQLLAFRQLVPVTFFVVYILALLLLVNSFLSPFVLLNLAYFSFATFEFLTSKVDDDKFKKSGLTYLIFNIGALVMHFSWAIGFLNKVIFKNQTDWIYGRRTLDS